MQLTHSDSLPQPVYEDELVRLYHADSLGLLDRLGTVDAVVTDPPYGDTSLDWDATPDPVWLDQAAEITDALWCFGSMRFHLDQGAAFTAAGWKLGQEVIWEKHNGSGFHADRFKRVHEIAVQWYRGEWAKLHKAVPVTMDATARTVVKRTKGRPTHHLGVRNDDTYVSEDGGPRLMRSVIQCRSEHGRAVHPTQKPLGILRPLIAYSVPPGGLVLDPFAGSGSTLLAARESGRRAIGIEARHDYCEAAIGRLSQLEMVA